MNYEDMSNWEITRRVVEIQCSGQNIKFLPQRDILEPMISGVMSDELKIITESDREQIIDVCNNPSDAWPIIVENGISIDFWGDSWGADIQLDGEVAFEHLDKNPLRAAMICFLKMKDTGK
ncbi:hypothetical protein [Vibrio phage 2E1]|nr:hypothetical protein [Vibrio phage 2E1]